jgi:hypothetical protein
MSNPKHGKGDKSPYRQLRPVLEWAKVDAQLIRAFVSAVTATGAGCGFGGTKRGDALSVSLITNGYRDSEYANSYEDVFPVMQDLLWRNDLDPLPTEPE